VAGLDFTDDGRSLLSSGHDGTWRLWDVAAPGGEWTLGVHRDRVRDLAFRRDGAVLACASFDGSVKVYEVETRRLLAEVPIGKSRVQCVAFGSGDRLFVGGGDGLCGVDTTRGEVERWTANPGGVLGVDAHPGGAWLASGGGDGTLAVWDVATRRALVRDAGVKPVWSVAFSRDGRLLASTSSDRVRVRRSGSWEVVRDLAHSSEVVSIAFHPVDDVLATITRYGVVCLWDTETWECRSLLLRTRNDAERIAWLPDGSRLAVAARRTVQIVDPDTGACLLTLRGEDAQIYGLAFSPDGSLLAAGGGARDGGGSSILLWGRTGDQPWPPALDD
jgi:WD40 repeat protein